MPLQPPSDGSTVPVPSEKGYYVARSNVATGSTSAQAYTATVTPQDAQATDTCGALAINDSGIKTPLATSTSSALNGSCW